MTVTVNWNSYADSLAQTWNIYKAVTGLVISFPNSLTVGDQLIFSATSRSKQTVTLTGTTIDDVQANINAQAKGVLATISNSGSTLLIRCTAKTHPKLTLYACTFLTDTSQPVRIIVPRSEFSLLTTVSSVTAPNAYSYTDLDGYPTDWYQITSVYDAVESLPSLDQKPLISPESLCVIEGCVINQQNDPIVGAEVKASTTEAVEYSDNSGIVTPDHVTLTDDLGRWSLPILQGKLVRVEIPSIGYNQVVQVPNQSFALFTTIQPTDEYQFDGGTGNPW